jgi:UV excision repair protein RAD23
MVTKAKKAAPAPAAPAPAAATPKVEAPVPATPSTGAATATTTPAPSASAPPAPPAPARDDFPPEAVENLTAMGFPEAEVRHCLRAAQGNPDVAVEFLTNGIPDGVAQVLSAQQQGSATPAANASSSSQTLQALRNHPQFNDLRRLVQSNPQMLQQVLAQIGQQQPELLAEINANQALFLEMMNEPVSASSPATQRSSSGGGRAVSASGGLPEGMGNPAQMAQMIQNMSADELEQMSQMMGLSPEQLRMTAQMLGQMPPEQLSQFMMQAMGAEGMGGGGGGQGQTVLRLTEEEMAAVDRLAEMGFDRSEAAQAFLACDKNEALAANLLMDSMGDGEGWGGGGGSGNNNSGGGNNEGSGNGGGGSNDDEDMYD